MKWISHYQLFLFDFDGLLVNTEYLHYQAYQTMCAQRGYVLEWDFPHYSQAAHHNATDLRDQIYATFPRLQQEEPNWAILYEEKKQAFISLIKQGAAQLMPGVADLLFALEKAQIKRCVVTHSATALITIIREQHAALQTIPHWMTREDYTHPKPNPECYQLAIDRLASSTDQVIGFEDSPRGLKALAGTRAVPVLVCAPDYSYVKSLLASHTPYYPSFTNLTDKNAPYLMTSPSSLG